MPFQTCFFIPSWQYCHVTAHRAGSVGSRSGAGSGAERALWAPGAEQALELTLWSTGAGQALEQTLWAPGLERTLWAPGLERALERTLWARVLKRSLRAASLYPKPSAAPLNLRANFLTSVLTEETQGLKLEYALVEEAADVRGWWTVWAHSPLSPHLAVWFRHVAWREMRRGLKCRRMCVF